MVNHCCTSLLLTLMESDVNTLTGGASALRPLAPSASQSCALDQHVSPHIHVRLVAPQQELPTLHHSPFRIGAPCPCRLLLVILNRGIASRSRRLPREHSSHPGTTVPSTRSLCPSALLLPRLSSSLPLQNRHPNLLPSPRSPNSFATHRVLRHLSPPYLI